MEGMIGEIRIFAGNFAPRSWAFCEGQLIPISQNTALFSILGTTYGGDGRTTFALPDLRGRVPIGPGTGPGLSTYRLGEQSGFESVTLTVSQMPNHTHLAAATVTPRAKGSNGDETNPNGGYLSNTNTDLYSSTADVNMGPAVASVTVQNTGGNQSHENRQPYLAIYYIICMFGIFPSRG